jgi:hypothetical protein
MTPQTHDPAGAGDAGHHEVPAGDDRSRARRDPGLRRDPVGRYTFGAAVAAASRDARPVVLEDAIDLYGAVDADFTPAERAAGYVWADTDTLIRRFTKPGFVHPYAGALRELFAAYVALATDLPTSADLSPSPDMAPATDVPAAPSSERGAGPEPMHTSRHPHRSRPLSMAP